MCGAWGLSVADSGQGMDFRVQLPAQWEMGADILGAVSTRKGACPNAAETCS